jgi:hypothetical protein
MLLGEAVASLCKPLLKSPHQLEYASGGISYRGIYFGQSFYAGQETVYHLKQVIWSMCYAGGWTENINDPEKAAVLGGFLQSAMRHIPKEHPFRGPLDHREAGYNYVNYQPACAVGSSLNLWVYLLTG